MGRNRPNRLGVSRLTAALSALAISLGGLVALSAAPAGAAPAYDAVCPVAGSGFDLTVQPDGVPATSQQFGNVDSIAVAPNHDLYIGDSGNYRVFKVDHTTQAITTVAGGGGALPGDGLQGTAVSVIPTGLAFDDARNALYISDANYGIIRKLDIATGVITTIAGEFNQHAPPDPSDSVPAPGDGGPATSARFEFQAGLAVHGDDLFVADVSDGRIRRIDLTTGIIHAFAGAAGAVVLGNDGPALAAQIRIPRSIAVDSSGNVFVTDTTHTVRIITTDGKIDVYAGSGTRGYIGATMTGSPGLARFGDPQGVAVEPVLSGRQHVYVADVTSGTVSDVTPDQNSAAIAPYRVDPIVGDGRSGSSGDGGLATAGHLAQPTAVAIRDGELFIADTGNRRVRHVSLPGNIITTYAGRGPSAVDSYNGPTESGGITNPIALTSDSRFEGAPVYYLDEGSNRVREITNPTGTRQTVDLAGTGESSYPGTDWSGDNVAGNQAAFDFTRNLNLISSGQPSLALRENTNVLYASEAIPRIRAITLPGGNVSTVAGDGTYGLGGDGGPATSAEFGSISDIAIHQASGRIFVADLGNATVRSFIPGQNIDKAVGTGTAGHAGDGGAATAAQTQTVSALTIHGDTLYVAEGGYIRRVDLGVSGVTGTITTYAGTGANDHTGDGGPATAAAVGEIEALDTDAAGNLYVASYVANVSTSIRRIDAVTGTITTVASGGWLGTTSPTGERPVADAAFGIPTSLDVSRDGETVLFADRVTRQIRSVNVGGCGSVAANGLVVAPLRSAGGTGIPVDQIPADRIPTPLTDIGAAPIRRIDLGATSLQSSALAEIPIRRIPIRRITLSSIPTAVGGGWAALLAGTDLAGVPLQNITLDQVFALPPSQISNEINGITLRDIDISSSPIRRISVASLALGSLPIRRIPLDDTLAADTATDAERFSAWCDAPNGLIPTLGFDCGALNVDSESPLLALDLASVPIRRIPIRRIPIRRILLDDSPIRRIPIRRIDLAASPIRRIPIRRIAASASPIRRIPIADLSVASRNAVLDCSSFNCTLAGATLEDAYAADAVRAEAQLGDIAPTEAFGNYELGDLVDAIDDTYSLADVLLGLVPRTALPWEDADLADLSLGPDYGLGQVNHQATFRLYDSRPGPTTLSATLGGDTHLAIGTASIIGPAPYVAPFPFTVTQTNSTVTFPSIPASAPPGVYTVTFGVGAGTQVGSFPISLQVGPVVDGGSTTTVLSTPAEVTDFNEPSNNSGFANLSPNALYLGHLGEAPGVQDVDRYQIPVPATAGTVTTITLSHLAVDGDLAAFPSVVTPPLRAGGFRRMGLQSAPAETQDPDLRTSVPGGQPGDVGDIPTITGSEPIAISAQRGTATEEIRLVSRGEGGSYQVQVSAYNGASSPEPYLVYVREDTPVGGGACDLRVTPPTVPNSLPATLPVGTKTLFLVNQARLAASNSTGDTARVMNGLAAVAADPNVKGVVVPVDASAAVRSAYEAWDGNGCNIDAANDVVNAINNVVDGLAPPDSAARAALESIVVVGGDDQIPMARVQDRTTKSNESDYAGDVRTADASGALVGPNPMSAALANRNILTDDPYGDFDPIAWKDSALYVPDVALGRLVESGAEIAQQLEAYAPRSGRATPTKSLVAGYDFLTDGSNEIDGALHSAIGGRVGGFTSDTLINENWTRSQLLNKLLPAPAPGVVSLNAHFDHHQALPAAGNTALDQSDLVTSADIAPANRLAGSIVFTLGCHSGLAFPDAYAGANAGTRKDDWAQTFGDQGALYVANTGFGYGDSATVALSERLMKLYALHLDGTTSAGGALQLAKQEYFAGMAAFSDYDAKVLMESTFYGIPTYEVGAPVLPPAPPAARAVSPDPVTGLSSTVVELTPDFTTVNRPDGTKYFTADGFDPQVTPGQPIQPRTEVDVTQPTDLAHGALITDLTSTDATVRATFASPTVDSAAAEPATASTGAAFPSTLQAISTFNAVTGQRQRLNLIPGQFVSAGQTGAAELGNQRLFNAVTARILYRPSTDADFTPPTASIVTAEGNGAGVSFSVTSAELPGSVVRVLVLYRDGAVWRSVDLSESSGVWVGSGATADPTVDYFVQLVDASGNVGVVSNKAANFVSAPIPPDPGNQSPSVNAGGNPTIIAGDALAQTGTFTDPDNGPWTATVDYGRTGDTAVPLALSANSFTLDAVYPNAGVFVATVTVCDAVGACSVDTINVTVSSPAVAAPIVSIGDATIVEGDAGANPTLKFPVHVSKPPGVALVLRYSTQASSASSGIDYTAKTNAALKIGATAVNGVISIPVRADAIDEADELLNVVLAPNPTGATLGRGTGAGVIVDDDPGSGHGVSISDATVIEGNTKTRTVALVVSLRSKDPSATHSVTYTTQVGTASGVAKATSVGGDYVTRSGTLVFKPNQFTKTIVITLKPDGVSEGNEFFTVNLVAGAGTVLARSTGRITVVDDD